MHNSVRAIIERIENGKKMVLIQRRVKNGIAKHFEFPGGHINEDESVIGALKREVLEETGLTVTKIHGIENYTHYKDTNVESVKPYSVFLIVHGWTSPSGERFKSVGVHFKCEADGEPFEKGDDSEAIQWATLEKLRELLDEPNMFSDIDMGAAETYLSEEGKQNIAR